MAETPDGLQLWFFPQHYILKPFRFSLLLFNEKEDVFYENSSSKNNCRKYCRLAAWLIGLAYICSCWGYFGYYLRSLFSGKHASIIGVISELPEYALTLRGPLVLLILYCKGHRISEVVTRSLYVTLNSDRINRFYWKLLSFVALFLSIILVIIEHIPSWYVHVWLTPVISSPALFSEVNQTVLEQTLNKTEWTDPVQISKEWRLIMHCIFRVVSYFLVDQIMFLLMLCALVTSTSLKKLNSQVSHASKSLQSESGVLEKAHFIFVDGMIAKYEETRQLWEKVNDEFMLLFSTACGLSITIMLGYVVSTVMHLQAGLGKDLSTWKKILGAFFAAVRVLVVTVPLVSIHEQVPDTYSVI